MQKSQINYTGKRLRTWMDFSFLYVTIKTGMEGDNLVFFTQNSIKREYYSALKP